MKRSVFIFGWGTFVVTCLFTAGAIVLLMNAPGKNFVGWLFYALAAPYTALVGSLIATRRSYNPIGWLALLISLAVAVATFAEQYALTQMQDGTLPEGVPLFAFWMSQWLWVVPNLGLALILLLFPTGHFLSPRWRVVAVLIAMIDLGLCLFGALGTPMMLDTLAGETISIPNPIGIFTVDQDLVASPFFSALLVVPFFLALSSMLLRFVRARGVERQQLKWFLYAAGLFVLCFFLGQVLPNPLFGTLTNLVTLGLPTAIGIAVLRYHLYDIDLIIRRTLTYGLLTVTLLGVFALCVIVLQQVFAVLTGLGQNDIVTVLSTLTIAALFIPLRNKIQAWIDRRFNRKKYDAQQVLADFALTVRDETDMERLTARLLQVVEETMEPKIVDLWLKNPSKSRRQE